ncbi:serine hydrolase domain-containing protein [Sphingosinithalassobacter portus]|uniref:serine hydrolase domain-containing protein n=1 Tax=Stakelama portus TaxID=2676234 RepID=UPI001379610D|nr:serine hydrolase domain-containing protein [Sphingosinithalassobacter portus]
MIGKLALAALLGGSSLAGAAIAAGPTQDAVQTTPAYAEATLGADGAFRTRAGNGGRDGARYQAGSTSKYACSLLAVILERDGKLRLSDTLADLLPGYTAPDADKITLRDLLHNRSGVADGLMAAFREDAAGLSQTELTPLDAANRFGLGRTGDAPGTAFDYVNTNWVLVQAVLEHAGGAPLEQMLQTRVFDPADMSSAVIMSDGHLPGADPVVASSPIIRIPDFVLCAGGLAATPDDLIRLLRFPYHAGKFTPAMIEAIETVASPDDHYALGGRVRRVRVDGAEHRIAWESGSNGAFKSYSVYDPEADMGYAVMTNEDDFDFIGERRDAWIRDVLGGELLD